MKRAGVSVILEIGIAAALSGCDQAEPVIHEVSSQGLGKEVSSFVDQVSADTGLFLYSRAGGKQYLIVNYSSVPLGGEAKLLKAVTAEVRDKTLSIYIEEQGTEDYQDTELGKLRIYELGDAEEYEAIQLFDNGKETSFDQAGT